MRSTLGQGSTFSVFLPAAEQVPAHKVEDITETGRLASLSTLTAEPGAVATTGGVVESIPPNEPSTSTELRNSAELLLGDRPSDRISAPSGEQPVVADSDKPAAAEAS